MATGITEQDVWTAADALLLEGLRPTIERLRQKLGRGSPNTVGPYLDTWFKGLGARIQDPGAFSAPASLPDPVLQAADYFWQAAQAQARAEAQADIAAAREELEAMRTALEAQRQALAQHEAAITARLEAVTAAWEEAKTHAADARQREAVCAQALAAAQARSAEQETALTALRMQLEQARADFDQERRAQADAARLQEQHWLQEIDRLRQRLKAAQDAGAQRERLLQEGLAAARNEAADFKATQARLQAELTQAQERLTEHVAALRETHTELLRERAQVGHLQGVLQEARRLRAKAARIRRPHLLIKRST